MARIGGNPDALINVSFVGGCIDNLESGSGSDLIYLQVRGASNAIVMQIGKIHQTSCSN